MAAADIIQSVMHIHAALGAKIQPIVPNFAATAISSMQLPGCPRVFLIVYIFQTIALAPVSIIFMAISHEFYLCLWLPESSYSYVQCFFYN